MPIQKVMLINPSNTMPRDSVRRLTTPMGFLYLGASLKKRGYDVQILDSPCEGYYQTRVDGDSISYGLSDDEIRLKVRDYKPDLVGVTSMFSAQQNNSLHHCDLVKSVTNAPVVLGGIHPSLFPQESASYSSVDYVIIGEGEARLLSLIETLENKKVPDFDGLAFKKAGEVVVNTMTSRIEDLDSLPLPARELINMEKYIGIGVPYAPFSRRERVEQIATSRGCPCNCVFCATVNYWGRKFRTRSVDNVMQEINQLVDNYGIQELQFADDNMTINRDRAKELFRKMAPYNLSWCTPSGLMALTIDDEMIDLMAKSGAYQLTFAIESGNDRVREQIIHKKVPSKERMKQIINRCHNHGIQVHGMFVVGFPGEKREEIDETLRYPYDTDFDSASFFIANPMPGSELYNYCKEKGYLIEGAKGNCKTAEIAIPRDSPDFFMNSRELEELVDKRAREFNEFSRQKNTHAWDEKFQLFLKRHPKDADLILGRVT